VEYARTRRRDFRTQCFRSARRLRIALIWSDDSQEQGTGGRAVRFQRVNLAKPCLPDKSAGGKVSPR
jgi:hypothetical protein